MREMIRRTLRTFIQAAVGYIGANIVYALTEDKTPEMLKTTLYGLLIAAIAAGIAAVMNMPEARGATSPVTVTPTAAETSTVTPTAAETPTVTQKAAAAFKPPATENKAETDTKAEDTAKETVAETVETDVDTEAVAETETEASDADDGNAG